MICLGIRFIISLMILGEWAVLQGIPIAVAAALAVQNIFEKEDIFKKSKEMSPYFLDSLFS